MTEPASSEIIILDFGSQYTQLIARSVRDLQVFSRIVPYGISADEVAEMAPAGIILSGGPASVYADGAPQPDPAIFGLGIPVLGICYGQQLMVHLLGGKVSPSERKEFGKATLETVQETPLFDGMPRSQQVWMSHGDKVLDLPDGFRVVAHTDNAECAAIANADGRIVGLQFHPEVVHTPNGRKIMENFCLRICGCDGTWTMRAFVERSVEEIRDTVGDGHVILGLSGGVDSTVAAALLNKAIGDQLTCIFVNNGLLRLDEAEEVQELCRRHFSLNLRYVDASDRFLDKLIGVCEPEEKRMIIGHEFIAVFEEESKTIDNVRFLAQGTTYPDVIESVSIDGNPSAVIKSHHNVGGLPETMELELLEPIRQLFKDEVRKVGEELGLPMEAVWRQPFPGPGLGVRVVGEVKREYVRVLQEADHIVVEEMKNADLYYKTWQTFAVFLPVRSVGVMGDERTYDHVIVLRAVESKDGMTADWVKLPYELLGLISNRIINEVRGINRVCYDISSKPPGTIEWE